MSPFPELRYDLVISEHKQDGQTVFVVKDPTTHKFYRFVSFQYYVATLLDGQTSLESVCTQVSDRMGHPIPLKSLEAFVKKMDSQGLLESFRQADETTSSVAAEHATATSSRPQSILYYKIPLINPSRLLDSLYAWCGFCFTPMFVVFSFLWCILSLWGIATDWDTYVGQLAAFQFTPSVFLSIYILSFIIIIIHEFAHGLACRHFGGTVSDMGFLLLYFMPALYTDVSDSYLFPRKKSRTIVMLAGMYSGILIIATAAIFWRLTDASTWIHQICFLVMIITGWGILFNLNPLIKLDGYYILNDWLDIPNLRRRAFAYLKRQFRWLTGLKITRSRRLSSRERWAYPFYGTLALSYSVLLIAFFANYIKDFAFEYAPELSMAGLAWSVVAWSKQVSGSGTSQPSSEITTSMETRMSFRSIIWGIILLIIISCLIFVEMELRISAPFQLRSRDQATVRSRVAGQLDHIFVNEGDTVQIGDRLAQLSTRDIDAQLRIVQAQIDQEQAQLALLKRGTRQEEIEQADAALQQALTDLQATNTRYDRASRLAEQQVIADQELDRARTDFERTQSEVNQARSRLKLLRAGSRQEEIEAMEAKIEGLSANAEHLMTQQQLCTLKSPITGIVTTPFLKERRGEYVEIGDVICELIDHRTMLVEMAIPEREMSDVVVGYPVKFKVQGFPSLDFFGEVNAIAPIASKQDGRSIFLVRSQINNDSNILKAGMTGSAKIYCGPQPMGSLMLRRLVRYVRTEFWW